MDRGWILRKRAVDQKAGQILGCSAFDGGLTAPHSPSDDNRRGLTAARSESTCSQVAEGTDKRPYGPGSDLGIAGKYRISFRKRRHAKCGTKSGSAVANIDYIVGNGRSSGCTFNVPAILRAGNPCAQSLADTYSGSSVQGIQRMTDFGPTFRQGCNHNGPNGMGF
jgi:hypothetical protein